MKYALFLVLFYYSEERMYLWIEHIIIIIIFLILFLANQFYYNQGRRTKNVQGEEFIFLGEESVVNSEQLYWFGGLKYRDSVVLHLVRRPWL